MRPPCVTEAWLESFRFKDRGERQDAGTVSDQSITHPPTSPPSNPVQGNVGGKQVLGWPGVRQRGAVGPTAIDLEGQTWPFKCLWNHKKRN